MSKSLSHCQVSDYTTPDIETEFIRLMQKMFNGELDEAGVGRVIKNMIDRNIINKKTMKAAVAKDFYYTLRKQGEASMEALFTVSVNYEIPIRTIQKYVYEVDVA